MMFKVYDKVYVLEDGIVELKLVYSIVQKMNPMKNGIRNGVETTYNLIDPYQGYVAGHSKEYKLGDIWESKEDLLLSL